MSCRSGTRTAAVKARRQQRIPHVRMQQRIQGKLKRPLAWTMTHRKISTLSRRHGKRRWSVLRTAPIAKHDESARTEP
ncbi:MAG: hypothetical protein RR326_07055, partial [Stenotrophomonas sp.]